MKEHESGDDQQGASARTGGETERALRRRIALLESQSEASPDGILLVDREGRIAWFNRRFLELWRLPPDVIDGGSDRGALQAVQEKVADPQAFLARVQHLYEHPEENSREDVQLKDGRVFDRHSAPVRADEGKIVGRVWFFRDVTQAREAERRKDEFLAMLGHELRNPLAPILNALTVLRGRENDAVAVARARDVLERQVRQMTRLVDDLLDVSRITRGKIELRKAPLELAHVIERAVEVSMPLMQERRHALTIDVPPDVIWLRADAARLEQILANLLNNAAKYSGPGGHVTLQVRMEEGEAVVRVRDDGAGMSPEFLARAFEPFAQAHRSPDRAQGGLGIGLTLVKRLVEMHDGQVTAVSEGAGKGTEVIVRLPLMDDLAPRRSSQDAMTIVPSAVRRRVLVVDDNVDAAATLAEFLTDCGHEVSVAHDGPRALTLAQESRPDVVLLDIGLPGMDGYEVAARLRQSEHSSQVQLVALSGYGQDEDRRRSFASGFTHHLVKPVDPDVLAKMLNIDEALGPPTSGPA